jgi:peptidoglycan LD-endopeptidase LytH
MAGRRPVVVKHAPPLASEWRVRRRRRWPVLPTAIGLVVAAAGLLVVNQPQVGSAVSSALGGAIGSVTTVVAPGSPPSDQAAGAGAPVTPPLSGSTPSPAPTRSARPTPEPSPTPSPSPPPGSAPTDARGFRFRDTVVLIGFPFHTGSGYTYHDNFGDRRVDEPLPFNTVQGRKPDGSLQRAHDGVDIYVEFGTPVLAPFNGRIIDPATRWKPWDRERYGKTVAIISNERTSKGYAALLVHMDTLSVRPGDRVRRGDVVGRIGDSGNAEGGAVHLHFELRAPFVISTTRGGVTRRLDVFDPYPSLYRADPNHR